MKINFSYWRQLYKRKISLSTTI